MICPNCKVDIIPVKEVDLEPMSIEEKNKRKGYLLCCGNCAHLFYLDLESERLLPFKPHMLEGIPPEVVGQIRQFQRNVFINSRRNQAEKN